MLYNTPLLRAALAHIEAHPREWNQASWRCGTKMCVAGHVAHLAGARWAYPESSESSDLPDLVRLPDSGISQEQFAEFARGAVPSIPVGTLHGLVDVAVYASEQLGFGGEFPVLTTPDGRFVSLFQGRTTLAEIREFVELAELANTRNDTTEFGREDVNRYRTYSQDAFGIAADAEAGLAEILGQNS